jgi:opacity protein-like surface antigen
MVEKNKFLFSGIIGLITLSASCAAFANYTMRDGKWERTFQLLSSQSTSINGENGTGVDIDSDTGWGFTLGYNLNQHVLINFEFSSLTPDYEATLIDDKGESHTINHEMNVVQSQLNLVYHFMTEQFTPFVQAGLGWSYLDSNIAKGPPNSICWWDPWWGYVCDNYQNTFNDTRFSYNVAAGVRYELDNSMFFRASYQQSWIDLTDSEDADIGSFHLEIGSIF